MGWFRRFGVWSLLFAWPPLVGDPLTVVAGMPRVGLLPFPALVALGKTARYVVVALAAVSARGDGRRSVATSPGRRP